MIPGPINDTHSLVLVTRNVEQYCHVWVPKGASDEEAVEVAKAQGDWRRTMNLPAADYAVVKEGEEAGNGQR